MTKCAQLFFFLSAVVSLLLRDVLLCFSPFSQCFIFSSFTIPRFEVGRHISFSASGEAKEAKLEKLLSLPSQWLCGRDHYMGNGTVTFPIWRDSIVGMWTHLDSKPECVKYWRVKEKNTATSSAPRWTFFVRFGGDHLLCVPLCPKSSIVLKVSFKQYRFAPQ